MPIIKKLLILTALFISGCSYNKEEILFPNTYCNTENVSYSNTITGIIANYDCLSCHGPTNPFAGFSLHTYQAVKAKVDEGRLFGAVNHTAGYFPMPQGGLRMNQCDIDKIKKWIDNGAPNN